MNKKGNKACFNTNLEINEVCNHVSMLQVSGIVLLSTFCAA